MVIVLDGHLAVQKMVHSSPEIGHRSEGFKAFSLHKSMVEVKGRLDVHSLFIP